MKPRLLLFLLLLACSPRDSTPPSTDTLPDMPPPATTSRTNPSHSSPADTTAPPINPAADPAPTGTAPTGTAAPPPSAANRPQLRPIDRAADDPAFLAYRNRLLAAVRARDTAALEPLVDPKIRISFGDGGGWAELRRKWELPSRDSPLWPELERILQLGGSFEELGGTRRFCAPYVYSDWPERFDPFEHLAVIGENVPLRERAAPDAPVVATLSYDIVRAVDHRFDQPWKQVELADKRKGWVRTEQVRSSIQYRTCFHRQGGEWRMALLVAGD